MVRKSGNFQVGVRMSQIPILHTKASSWSTHGSLWGSYAYLPAVPREFYAKEMKQTGNLESDLNWMDRTATAQNVLVTKLM